MADYIPKKDDGEARFFVPALRKGFFTAGNCGAKKGGVNDLQKT
jgi:hypothetical protein